MSLFSFNKNKPIEMTGECEVNKDFLEKKVEKEQEPRYVWVKGFKGTNSALQGYGDFQYVLGETYSIDDKPVLCEKGFHFSLKLEDVFRYYYLRDNNRFFEVEALVDKNILDRYGMVFFTGPHGSTNYNRVDKIAAKKIKLVRELTVEELFPHWGFAKYKDLFTIDDLKYRISSSLNTTEYLVKKSRETLKGKYSDTFITILFTEEDEYRKIIERLQLALALYDEGVSPDVRAYLLLKGG